MIGFLRRRRNRRHMRVLALLASEGPMHVKNMWDLLGCRAGSLYVALARLERNRQVVSWWGEPNPDTGLRRRVYDVAWRGQEVRS